MMDSLAYRNDAAHGPAAPDPLAAHPARRDGDCHLRQGAAGDDDGAGVEADLPCIAGARRGDPPAGSGEDAGKIQSIGARFAHGQITLEQAADLGCRACASPGGGCQFLGTAATTQVVAEALGLSLTHSALAPSGQPIWLDAAARAARALVAARGARAPTRDILTAEAIHNAMTVHAAFGGSTNLLLHIPAIAHAAGLPPATRRGLERD